MDKAFDILAEFWRPMVKAYANTLTNDPHVAEDITQETFMSAFERLDDFDESQCFGKWLRGIARNKVRNYRKRAHLRSPIIDPKVLEGIELVYNAYDSPDSQRHSRWEDR